MIKPLKYSTLPEPSVDFHLDQNIWTNSASPNAHQYHAGLTQFSSSEIMLFSIFF